MRDSNKIHNPNSGNLKWRDFRKSGGQWQQRYRPKQHFPFYYNEETDELSLKKSKAFPIEIIPQNAQGEKGFWENGYETTTKRLKNGELKASKNIKTNQYKILQLEQANELQNAGNFIDIPSVNGSLEIKQFDLEFNNVKPVALIKYILALAAKDNSIVLDFFAGSGSTGQAVMEWNQDNNFTQSSILCTNNEYNLCTVSYLPASEKSPQWIYQQTTEKVYRPSAKLNLFKS